MRLCVDVCLYFCGKEINLESWIQRFFLFRVALTDVAGLLCLENYSLSFNYQIRACHWNNILFTSMHVHVGWEGGGFTLSRLNACFDCIAGITKVLYLSCWPHDIDSIKTGKRLMVNNKIFDVFHGLAVDSCNSDDEILLFQYHIYRSFGPMTRRTVDLSDQWPFGLLVIRTIDPSDQWHNITHRNIDLSDQWAFGL